MMQLLLIEAFASERTPLARQLLAAGLRLGYARCPSEARDRMAGRRYDLALIDLSLRHHWAQVLLDERQTGAHVPMIALVPKETLAGRGRRLAHRADDWVSKPVAVPELMARISAIIERDSGEAAKTYRAGALMVCPDVGRATYGGTPLALSRRELSALVLLVRYAPHPVLRQTLESAVHGPGAAVSPNAIEAVLSRLRRALKAAGCPARIVVLRGIGWRLMTPEPNGDQTQ